MELVNEGYKGWRCKNNHEDMTKQKVRAPKRHLDNLDNVFTSGLRQCRGTKAPTVPLAGPPSSVRLVVLIFTSQEYRNKDLLDSTLNGDDGNDTEHCVRSVPQLQEPLQKMVTIMTSRVKA